MALSWCDWCEPGLPRLLGTYIIRLRDDGGARSLCAACLHDGLDRGLIWKIQHPNPWRTSPPIYERTWTPRNLRSWEKRRSRLATSSTSTSEPSRRVS